MGESSVELPIPTSEAAGARAIENQRSNWFSTAFFVSAVVGVFTNNILALPFLVSHQTSKGKNVFIRCLFGFMAAIVGSLNPNIRGSGARAIENQRSNWFSTAFFVSFLAEQKRKDI